MFSRWRPSSEAGRMKRRIADELPINGILAAARLHRPYASMNWIRFNGSLRALAVSQPLAGTPLVNGAIRDGYRRGVKMVFAPAKSRAQGSRHACKCKVLNLLTVRVEAP
jgi:hypothetical protein